MQARQNAHFLFSLCAVVVTTRLPIGQTCVHTLHPVHLSVCIFNALPLLKEGIILFILAILLWSFLPSAVDDGISFF